MPGVCIPARDVTFTHIMSISNLNLKCALTALMAMVMFSLPARADELAKLDPLFEQLKQANAADAVRIAREINLELSKSGSPAMDLLLKRGQDALEAGDIQAAIGHFTALTDHAPDFAEGWHMRSLAYAETGLYGPALNDLEHALALRPRHFRAIFGLGVILEELDQPKQALAAYKKAQAIYPGFEGINEFIDRVSRDLDGENI